MLRWHVACGRTLGLLVMLAMGCVSASTRTPPVQAGVQVVPNEAARRVDVFVDGKPFTAYIWPETIKKPVLFPLRTAQGATVTRGYPLEPRTGERIDHPHQVGVWFNYGDVNGLDFWNNSEAIKPAERQKYGTIRHLRIKRVASGKDRGELEVETEWLTPDGRALLREETTFVFHAGPNLRAIDRITRLTALAERVVFHDNKEGVLGIRVARQLEQPSNQPEVYTDASGKATAVAKMDNTGVTGRYQSSEGKTGDAVWGTRGKWAMLAGRIGAEDVTLAILDHPRNPGYPTYWHARGYGLFAANPLGQEVFSNGKEKLNFTLEPRQSATFRYRLLILSGKTNADNLESRYRSFIGEVQ
ncbi:MAG TPA: PmoA family protein [Blastocatellia bacterium]|nr:PmoA family protein [Blastocatellia bacterium]